MKVFTTELNPRIETRMYTLIVDRKQLLARLQIKNSDLYYYMSLLSAIDTVGNADQTVAIEDVRIQKKDRYYLVEIRQKSGQWTQKHSYYKCFEDTLEYYVVVQGEGKVDRSYFFRGRLGASELGSIPGFDYLFTACPNFLEKNYFHASEYASINAGHENFAWGFALSSGPLCYTFTNNFQPPWLSVGVAAKEGDYKFQSFEFNHKPESVQKTHDSIVGTQSFSLTYFGHLSVSGTWETPHLVFNFAREKYAAIKKYVGWLYKNGYLQKPKTPKYEWWNRPIFCGWHEQVAIGCAGYKGEDVNRMVLDTTITRTFAACTQANHETWLARLHTNGVHPGIIILDALWQVASDFNEVDTKKWPDLRGFIDRCHARNQKVLLWVCAWVKKDKIPEDECLMMDGKPFCFDPTHPNYIRRLKDQIRVMLSDEPGCYNADGLKVDGTSVEPYGYEMKTQGDLYGFELQKYYLKLLYENAKAIKKDALVNLFVANPYFRDVCDMVRTGDMYTVKGDPRDTLRTRAKIISIGMPGVVIDTDGEFFYSKKTQYLDLMKEQAKLGVPTLYQAEKICRLRTFSLPEFETFTPADYRRIAKIWKLYEAKR